VKGSHFSTERLGVVTFKKE